jgi:hypothetical protein
VSGRKKSSSGPDPAAARHQRILRRLRGLKEKAHKRATLEAWLQKEGEAAFEEFLQWVLVRSGRGLKQAQGDLLLVIAEFSVSLPDETKASLASIASEREHEETLSFLSSPRFTVPHLEPGDKVLKGRDGKPLTLGERKSAARNPGRHILTRLIGDPSPDVIRHLLASPRITEKDVVRMAALRPAQPQVLRVIFESPRWISSYRVKLTLASNPYLAPEIGIKLVPSLLRQDLVRLSRDNLVHPDIRQAMKQALDRQSPEQEGPWPADEAEEAAHDPEDAERTLEKEGFNEDSKLIN